MQGDNIYPDFSNDKFDIQYARLMGLSSDLQASFGVVESILPPGKFGPIDTPSDTDTGLIRFGVVNEDALATENRSFDLAAGFSFALTQLGNNHFLVDPPNGLYQLGAVPVPGSDSGLSYTYLQIDDTDKKILLQAPEGIVATGYGYGNHAGTAAFNLAVDAGGNIIEVATGGSGSGTVNSGLFRKAAYYITNPSGTIVDDWAGVEFNNTNLNTKIIQQATGDIGLEIKGIAAQTGNYLNISSSAGTGDLMKITKDGYLYFPASAYPAPIISFGTAYFTTHATGGLVQINASGGIGGAFTSAGDSIFTYNDLSIVHLGGGPISGNYTAEVNGSFNVSTNSLFGSTTPTTPARTVHILKDDATTSAVTYLQRLTHTSSGTPAIGIGVGIEFEAETSANNNEIGATIDAVTTYVGAGFEDFDLVIKLMAGGSAAAEKLRVLSTGELKVQLLTQDDTETKVVVWNSTDKILEWRDASTLTGGGSVTADNGLTMSTATNVQLGSDAYPGADLLHDSYIDMNGFTLFMVGGSVPVLNIQAGGATGIVTEGVDGIGIQAASRTSYGVYTISNDLGTTNVAGAISIVRNTANTAANGIGVSADFFVQSSTSNTRLSNQIISKWTDATDATRTSQLDITGVYNATTNTIFSGTGRGNIEIGDVGGLFSQLKITIDQASKAIYLDSKATGDVVMGDVFGAGSATYLGISDGSKLIQFNAEKIQLKPISATDASAITPSAAMVIFVNSTNGTFTAVGFWGYDGTNWTQF